MSRETDRVEVFRGDDGDWYWRRIATNGEELSRSSEGYQEQGEAVHMAGTVNKGIGITLTEPAGTGTRPDNAEPGTPA